MFGNPGYGPVKLHSLGDWGMPPGPQPKISCGNDAGKTQDTYTVFKNILIKNTATIFNKPLS